MLYLRFSFELRTAKVMSYTIRSQSKDNSLIDCEISNLIIVNNSRLLRTTLSNLSEGKRREVLNKVDSYGNTCLGLACNNDAEGGILGILIEVRYYIVRFYLFTFSVTADYLAMSNKICC